MRALEAYVSESTIDDAGSMSDEKRKGRGEGQFLCPECGSRFSTKGGLVWALTILDPFETHILFRHSTSERTAMVESGGAIGVGSIKRQEEEDALDQKVLQLFVQLVARGIVLVILFTVPSGIPLDSSSCRPYKCS